MRRASPGMEPRLRDVVLLRERVQNANVYPFTVPVLRTFERLTLTRRVTFFIGENGSGKSTLLEAIAIAIGFRPEGGSPSFGPATTASTAASAPLAAALRLSWTKKVKRGFFLRAESLFNVATALDVMSTEPGGADTFAGYGGKSLHEQSHGESFLALFRHRFVPGGIYLLDEPEAAVSPQRQLSLLGLIHQIVEAHPDTQFLIATHSPILLGYPEAQILSFDGDQLAEVTWDQAEPVQVTLSFLTKRDWWLRRLLDG
jgi:predicted ATPase